MARANERERVIDCLASPTVKSKFGNILEKVGISQNGGELFWEFQGFEWEFHSFGSNNTVSSSAKAVQQVQLKIHVCVLF